MAFISTKKQNQKKAKRRRKKVFLLSFFKALQTSLPGFFTFTFFYPARVPAFSDKEKGYLYPHRYYFLQYL